MSERADLIYSLQLIEQADRLGGSECLAKLTELCSQGGISKEEEMHIFGEILQKSAHKFRWQLEILRQMQKAAQKRLTSQMYTLISGEVEALLNHSIQYIDSIRSLLTDHVIPNGATAVVKVWASKTLADSYRYNCTLLALPLELNEAYEASLNTFKTKAKEAYEDADQLAENLDKEHILALGVSLNNACFNYEVLKKREYACDILKQALKQAERANDHHCKTIVEMQMENNLKLWKHEKTFTCK